LDEWAARTPLAAAVVEGDGAVSFRDLADASLRAAARFRAAGWNEGALVAVSLSGPSALQLAVLFGLARIGAVQLVLPVTEPAAAKAALLRRFRIAGAVVDGPTAGARTTLVAADPGWLVPRSGDAARPETGGGSATTAGDDTAWMIVLSSGTTGIPKAMHVTHALDLERSRIQPDCIRLRPEDRFQSLVSIDYRVGRSAAVKCLGQGATLVAPPDGNGPDHIMASWDRHRVTAAMATPSQLARLVDEVPDGDGPRFPALRLLRTTSGAMRPELIDRVRTRITAELHVEYGTNDAGTLAVATPEMLARHPDTAGRPVPGLEIEIVDDAGRPLPVGEPGHIRVRGPGVASGYLDDPEATRRYFRDGWFHPGDVVERDRDGLLFVRGRSDDQMNVGGIKILPGEIESVALAHPDVRDAAAFAVPSERYEHLPALAVVLRQGGDRDAVRLFCVQRLGSRAPRLVVVVSALPRNALGKVLRRELSDLVAERLARTRRPAGLAKDSPMTDIDASQRPLRR